MGYKGYFKFDGTEVINVARTMAYIKAGIRPPDVEFDAPVAYDGLADALGEHYRTPVLDQAPWYDVNRPATHGFAGVLPIDITGLDGSTAAREVVENVDDGGVAQMVRRTTRTLAASALLVGDSSEAVYAGLEWLTTVLLRECTDTTYSARLEGFNVLPAGFTDVEDLTASLIDTPVDPEAAGWRGYGGTWHPDAEVFAVEPLRGEPPALLDGGRPWTMEHDPLLDGGSPADDGPPPDADGGDPEDAGDEADAGGIDGSEFTLHADGGTVTSGDFELFADGGDLTEGTLDPYARLVPPVELTCLSEVTVTWTITPSSDTEPVVVQVGAVDALGRELYRQPTTHIVAADDDPLELTWTWQHAKWDQWWPALWVSAPGAEVAVSVARRPFLDAEACLSPIRRTYAELSTVSAPNVVADYADDCDNKMLQVEWTWSVGNPYRYGDPVSLVQALASNTDGAPASSAPGVGHDFLGTVSSASTACTAPSTLPPSCAYDPDLPGFDAPPEAPVISDGTVLPTNFNRSLLSIDPGVLPESGKVALAWVLENDGTAKHNVRVRIWRQADPDFATHTECDFLTEFWITYIDGDAVFTIDGPNGNVIALCDGSPVPASGVMRGPYRGAFEPPVLSCGGRYFVAVDTASTEGALNWSLSYSPREG